MDKTRWQKISDLASDLLEIPEADRKSILEESCRLPNGEIDSVLIQEVIDLVAASQEADDESYFSSPFLGVASVAADELDLASTSGEQRQIASWTIIDTLGAGGMGVVYHAERIDKSFNQQAALKLVKPGFGDDFRQRFIQERALLAQLNHPGIARLLDGGIDENDQPYLAMELVEGVPITDYCHSSGLNIDQSIELFIQACDALDYAHRNLVVHQDIKPNHLLVEVSTGKPQVKLLDFGIAHISSPGKDLSEDGFGMLTPAYASPEQLEKKTITTSTDVYSLGVVLYELLSGEKPFRTENLTVSEVQELVGESRPTRPSERVREPSLSKRLKGDLDSIVSKALSIEPEKRYPSARALADDLQNYLRSQPIQARRHDFRYLSKKFVRRNRSNVIAGVLTFVLLSTIVGVFLSQLTTERNKAQLAAIEAEEKARQKETIAGFLEGILRAPNDRWYNDFQSGGPDIKVAEVLNIISGQVDSVFSDEPEVAADLHHILGDTYGSIDINSDRTSFHHRRVLELRERVFEAPHPKIAEAYYYLSAAQKEPGDVADRLINLLKAYKMLKANPSGNNFPFIASELSGLALQVGRVDLAEILAKESIDYVSSVFVPGHDGHKYRETLLFNYYNQSLPIAIQKMDFQDIRNILRETYKSIDKQKRLNKNLRWRVLNGYEARLHLLLDDFETAEQKLLNSMELPGAERNPYPESSLEQSTEYLLDNMNWRLWSDLYTALKQPQKVAIFAAKVDSIDTLEDSMTAEILSTGIMDKPVAEILN